MSEGWPIEWPEQWPDDGLFRRQDADGRLNEFRFQRVPHRDVGHGFELYPVDPATTNEERGRWHVPTLAEAQARAATFNRPEPESEAAPAEADVEPGPEHR